MVPSAHVACQNLPFRPWSVLARDVVKEEHSSTYGGIVHRYCPFGPLFVNIYRTVWVSIFLSHQSTSCSTSLSPAINAVLSPLLNPAKCLIHSIHWKSQRIPREQDWVGKVTEIMEVEEWIATCRGIWECFDCLGPMADSCSSHGPSFF